MPRKKKPVPAAVLVDIAQTGVIYARYSSHAQKDVSIEQQVEECTRYAKENGITIIDIYADRAISGKTDQRPEFQKLLRDAENGLFDFLIAWKSNRIGRNMLQAMLNEAKLNDLGVRVLYTEEQFDDSAAGRFALRTMMNVNQFYSENMAEDIKRGLYNNAAKCMITNGGLPFGYKKGEDGRYAIDEPKDEIVREIFKRVACGESFVDIYTDLNARGIKTSRGNVWKKSSFHALLSNERYTGVYIYGDVRIEGGVPQIVDKGLFLRVQEVLKTKKNPRGRHRINGDYALTGKLFCGKCKSPMIGVSGTSRNGNLHYYYICQNRRRKRICKQATVRRDWIEQEVANSVKKYVLQDDVISWIADITAEYSRNDVEQSNIKLLEDSIADNRRAIKNILSAIELGIITPATKDRLKELEEQVQQLESQLYLRRLEIIDVSREDVIAWLESFRDGVANDKKFQAELFEVFLQAVYIYYNKLKIVFSFSGSKNTINIPIDSNIDNLELNIKAGCSLKVSSEPP